MINKNDVYYTIASPCRDGLYKEKGSKFIGLSYPVSSQDQIDQYLFKQLFSRVKKFLKRGLGIIVMVKRDIELSRLDRKQGSRVTMS